MKETVKSLHLILYSINDDDYKNVLEDAIFFDPNYKIGDVVEILSTNKHDPGNREIIRYKVLQVQKIIAVDKTGNFPSEHKLFVKVSEIQREESSSTSNNASFIIKGNQTEN